MAFGRSLQAVTFALPFLMTAPVRAASVQLPSFEAVYEIRLTQASSTGGPRAAVGQMEWRFAQTCDGWDTKTHTSMSLHFGDDSRAENERFFQSFEHKNGRDYTFAVQTIKNGHLEENFRGKATIGRRGGEVRYELLPVEDQPKARNVNIPLPQGTLFPVAHTLGLLGSAERGSSLYNTVVLNGSSSVGPRRHSIAIGPRNADTLTTEPNVDRSLLGAPSWRMSTAMFDLFERRDTPNSEVFQQYHGSGITEFFEQTFRDFRISARLTQLKRLEPPKCK